jgi:diguanylate cyclase (GGDEF)-like protein
LDTTGFFTDYSQQNYTSSTILVWNLKENTFFHTNAYRLYKINEADLKNLYHNRNSLTCIHTDDIQGVVFFMQNIMEGAAHEVVFARLLTAEGTWRWSRIGAETIVDESGEIVNIVAVILDIEDVLKDRVQLKTTTENLNCILDSVPVGINVLELENNRDFRLKYVNNRIYSMFDMSEEDYDLFFHNKLTSEIPEDCLLAQFIRQHGQQLIEQGTVETIIPGRKKSGAKLWIRVKGLVCNYDDRSCCYLSLSDVTSVIDSQRRECWQNERYQLLVESHGFISFDYDPDEEILTFGEKQENGEYGEIVLRDFRRRIPEFAAPESIAAVYHHAEKARNSACRGVFEMKNIWNGKNCWNKIKYVSVADENGHVYRTVGLMEDITDEKKKVAHLLDLSRKDSLTGFLNRKAFQEYCDVWEKNNADNKFCGLALIELDQYSEIVRKFGHTQGEKNLRQTALTMNAFLHNGDVCGRFSDSVFAVCINGEKNMNNLRERARILLMALQQQSDNGLAVTASIGIALSDCIINNFDEIYVQADRALRMARQSGGNRSIYYSEELENIPSYQYEQDPTFISGASSICSTPSELILDQEQEVKQEQVATLITTDNEHTVVFRTFGYFDIFVDGQAVTFSHSKAQELLALLIDRNGCYVSSQEAIKCLWPEDEIDKTTLGRYRKVLMWLRQFLKQHDISDIVETQHGSQRINTAKINCDLYEYLSEEMEYRNLFRGSYLLNYSWSENTTAKLEEKRSS